jgi:amino acid adenylation domain-containing protein
MWFVQQFEPRGTAYNMPLALRLKGPLNMAALEAAVQAIVRRHEAFRTTFRVANGEPVQVIGSHQPARIRHIDLRTLPDDRREAQARRLFRDESLQPFDLEHGPLFRFVVVQIADADHAMLWLVHHAVGDQWSFSILVRDLASYYGACLRGEQPAEQPLAIQYADFAAWQRHRHSGAALDNQLAYWKDRLRELPVLALPTDHPRPPQQTFRGSNLQATIAPALLAVLKKVSAREGVTPFMTLLACFKLLLARYSGQEDFAVGVPIANRTHVAAEDLVGTLVNTLVLRTSLGGDPTFKTLLTRIRETALGAYAHQDLPFERLVDELDVKREGGRSPLVQVLFNVPNAPMYDMDLSGLEYELFDFDSGAAQFDLSMSVETEIFGRVYLSYAIDMFEPATAQRLLEHYLRLLEQVLADPDRPLSAYEILNDAERQTLLTDWNRTQTPYPAERRADELIATQAAASPEAVAMSMDGQHLTYGDLEARANRLARYLQQRGVRRNSAVGICLERSTDLVVALLATMKSGGTYIPLDPAFPRDRLQFMARDADLKALVTHSELLQTLPEMSGRAVCLDDAAAAVAMLPDGPLEPGSGPDDLAYVLYTSGSTGKPKGVEISHRALTNFLCSMRTTPGCSGADRLLAVTTLSFDIAGLEIYLPLISGGKVELASRQEAADGRLLKERLREYRPTLMQATPATWRMLIAAGWHGNRRLRILCGGEALPADLAVQLLERCGELWNMYGPTETTIWSTMTRIRDAQTPISIGRPIANTQVYVLDRTLQPVPVGVAGELYIGGHGLARGYRNRTTLTAERFIAHPFAEHPGERLYRTGDLVRWSADGRLHHMGRLDFQVKIRGFRIELGEIEARLARHPAIAQAVATARPNRDGQNQLVAYIRAREGHAQPEAVELRTFVRTTLPDYMTPAHFVFLQAFPLTANNKIDIKALPEPVVASSARAAPAQPQGRLEVQLTALWRQVLEDETLGVHENFFDAGGHSLKAVQLVSYIEQVCGQTLPLATLFEAPTVAQMARLLQKNWKPSWDSLVAIQPAGDETPIFAVPGVGGNVLMFARLSKLMGTQRPFYGLQARGLDSAQKPFTSVRRMAAHYTQEIRSIRPRGPYIIAGACTGGVIAFEMARQLVAAGEKVTLMLMESWHPISARGPLFSGMLLWPMWALWQRITRRSGRDRVARATWHAVANYRPPPIAARMLHVIAAERPLHPRTADTRRMWDALTTEGCETHYMPALDSGQLFTPRHAGELADIVRDYIAREQG